MAVERVDNFFTFHFTDTLPLFCSSLLEGKALVFPIFKTFMNTP